MSSALYSVAPPARPQDLDDEANKGHGAALKPQSAQKQPLPSAPQKQTWVDWLCSSDTLVPWCVLAVALFTRFYRLADPHGVGAWVWGKRSCAGGRGALLPIFYLPYLSLPFPQSPFTSFFLCVSVPWNPPPLTQQHAHTIPHIAPLPSPPPHSSFFSLLCQCLMSPTLGASQTSTLRALIFLTSTRPWAS